jgi:hypothetical protein
VSERRNHYVGLLGEPTINVTSAEGERNVQWHTSPYPPWIVGVLGEPSEAIASVSKPPQR